MLGKYKISDFCRYDEFDAQQDITHPVAVVVRNIPQDWDSQKVLEYFKEAARDKLDRNSNPQNQDLFLAMIELGKFW